MKKWLTLVFLLVLLPGLNGIKAASDNNDSKREFRGLFVSTLNNQDFNISENIEEFKVQYLKILDMMVEHKFNTIVFQVRPQNDAFYNSDIHPWSRYFTGEEGKNPGFDPMPWMIEETHKRGIYYYASLELNNVVKSTNLAKMTYLSTLSETNYAYKNPQNVLATKNEDGTNNLSLNIGEENVRKVIVDTVMEIINKYDIDGINVGGDLYNASITDEDQFTYLDSDTSLTIVDFRKENIISLLSQINNRIKTINKGINFGLTLDNKNYLDLTKIVNLGIVDYIVPELESENNLENLMNISKNSKVNLYVNHSLELSGSIINDQLTYIKGKSEISGSVFYNYEILFSPENELSTTIKAFWSNYALHPLVPNIDSTAPEIIKNLAILYNGNEVVLSWDNTEARSYVVYRFNSKDLFNSNNSSKIKGIIIGDKNEQIHFYDNDVDEGNSYVYYVTTLDNSFNESLPESKSIDLTPNQHFKQEIITLAVLNFIALSVIIVTSVIAFRKK